jgi:hypothetical protein
MMTLRRATELLDAGRRHWREVMMGARPPQTPAEIACDHEAAYWFERGVSEEADEAEGGRA